MPLFCSGEPGTCEDSATEDWRGMKTNFHGKVFSLSKQRKVVVGESDVFTFNLREKEK